jgi:hypothetical protein
MSGTVVFGAAGKAGRLRSPMPNRMQCASIWSVWSRNGPTSTLAL